MDSPNAASPDPVAAIQAEVDRLQAELAGFDRLRAKLEKWEELLAEAKALKNEDTLPLFPASVPDVRQRDGNGRFLSRGRVEPPSPSARSYAGMTIIDACVDFLNTRPLGAHCNIRTIADALQAGGFKPEKKPREIYNSIHAALRDENKKKVPRIVQREEWDKEWGLPEWVTPKSNEDLRD